MLYIHFEVSLFETVSMLLFLNIFHSWVHFAFFLPVAFLADVAGCRRNGKIAIGELDDLIHYMGVLNATEIRVQLEILSNNFQCNFD